MGTEVDPSRIDAAGRAAFRARLHQSLDVLAAMLTDHERATTAGRAQDSPFEDGEPRTGMEVECVLVADDRGRATSTSPAARTGAGAGNQTPGEPHPTAPRVLERLQGRPEPRTGASWTPEIGNHTIELNVAPSTAAGNALAALEDDLRAQLTAADTAAAEHGSRLLLVGVLPTLTADHLRGDWRTPSPRYAAVGDAVLAARGEDIALDITGPDTAERLTLRLPSIAAEAACTSTQLHLKTSPEDFAATWNAAQLLAGPQLALAANSPFALGRSLWAESRVPLFTQSVDTRTPELIAQGVAPRVFAGGGWITSVLDLFTQDVTWFPPLLPQVEEEDPAQVRADGGVPALAELGLHSGTVWRWNRPVYDVTGTGADARAHLRVENRVLPSGPTVADTVANAAVFYGAVRMLVEAGPDPAQVLGADEPERAITACAQRGLDAELAWPGAGRLRARTVLLDHVLPLAAQGLARWGVPTALADRYLDIAATRAATGRTGSWWARTVVAAREEGGAGRAQALSSMLAEYADLQGAGEPVHTWPTP